MSLFEYYIRYLTAVCEGTLVIPGLESGKTDETERAVELQQKIAAMGIPAFVRLCAAQTGEEIPESAYAEFDQEQLRAALQSAAENLREPPENTPEGLPEEAPAEKENAWEAFLDCVCLEDALLEYLIEILKKKDGLAFFKLSQVTVRRELKLEDFLFWFGTKEYYADEAERGCVAVIDAMTDRLAKEGRLDVIAALISGDRTTFELIRCEAPELVQLPAATYAWFAEYYLNRYYPVRAILRLRGIVFPAPQIEEE